MMRFVCAVALIGSASPLFAASAKDCGYQADVVNAVQTARLAKVKEREVPKHVAASGPAWPEAYNNVVPLVTPWIYEMKMAEVKSADLGAAWKEMCLKQ